MSNHFQLWTEMNRVLGAIRARRWQSTGAAVKEAPAVGVTTSMRDRLSNAEYETRVKRGTAGLYESIHHKEVRRNYPRHQLRANFWGPREWFQLARRKAQRLKTKNFTEIVALQQSILRHHQEAPAGYPFLPIKVPQELVEQCRHADHAEKEDSAQQERAQMPAVDSLQQPSYKLVAVQDILRNVTASDSSKKRLWDRFRRACSVLYPTSPYAVEERVVDDWAFFLSGRSTTSPLPKRVVVGGAPIKLINPYARRRRGLSLPEGCSEEARQMLGQIDADCNPFHPTKVPSTLLQDFVERALQTEDDVRRGLPLMLQRWRWLTMGQLQNEFASYRQTGAAPFEEPSQQMSDDILRACAEFGQPMTGVQLLRFRPNYKLTPSAEGVQALMDALVVHHHAMVTNPPSEVPEPVEEEKPPVNPYANKRSVPKHAFPFRMGPRFYFYRQLPFVLNPEPSPFAQMSLPQLPEDNETKRLLADDQRKKLKMIMDEAQKASFKEDRQREAAETPGLRVLTGMFEVFGLALGQGPRHYGLESTTGLYDSLIVAGVVGGTDEGLERSLETAKEAHARGQLSSSAHAVLLAAVKDEKEREALLSWDRSSLASDDRLGFGFLAPVLAPGHNIPPTAQPSTETSTESPTIDAVRDLLQQTLKPVVQQQLASIKEQDAQRHASLVELLEQHPRARPFLG